MVTKDISSHLSYGVGRSSLEIPSKSECVSKKIQVHTRFRNNMENRMLGDIIITICVGINTMDENHHG